MGIHAHATVEESARLADALLEAIGSALAAARATEDSSASTPH